MSLKFASDTSHSLPLHVVSKAELANWLQMQSDAHRTWLESTGFTAALGQVALLPGSNGAVSGAVLGTGLANDQKRQRFILARAQAVLPDGTYHLADGTPGLDINEQALGWLLSQYRYGRYKKPKPAGATLVAPAGIDANRLQTIAAGESMTRDLINVPTNDMGPDKLQEAVETLAQQHNATCRTVLGDALQSENFPLIHAVGRASAIAPRLIEFNWGNSGPALTLVGKGVCFDTGGLNLKPGAAMGLMKKDMGGAATVLGLAHMIMDLELPLRLRVLIPAVENAIDGNAFRPGDVLTARNGMTVEINNTDAEGRLVLADALALADETPPDLLISMATLTGAARVAVGSDLAPYYATTPTLADHIRCGAISAADPVWEMPFHDAYESMIEPEIADLDNAPKGGFAGSITAALFLRRFVANTNEYAHFDIYGWQPNAAPARPKGGVGMGARAILDALPMALNI